MRAHDRRNELGGGAGALPGLPAAALRWLEPAVILLALAALAAGAGLAPERTAMALAAITLGVPLLLLLRARPELGLLALVFMTSNFVPADLIDVRLLGGGLDVRDLTLIGLLAAALVAHARRGTLQIPWWPVSGPLFAFLGVATFSALYAVLRYGVEPRWALSELRPLLYYTCFLPAAWLLVRRGQLVVLLAGLLVLADFTGLIILLQQFLGRNNQLLAVMSNTAAWYIPAADTPDEFGLIRIVPPGHVLTYLISIIAFCFALAARQSLRMRLFFSLQFLFLNVALLFTYTRAQWVASTLALTVLVILSPGRDKRTVGAALVALALVGALASGLFSEQLTRLNEVAFVGALRERALSIFTPGETLESNSLAWRVLESQEALRSIREHPLLGVGLGNSYREPFLIQGEAGGLGLRFTRFVHNSYLYLAVKLGLVGVAALLWFALAFLAGGWLAARRLRDEHGRRLVLAILAGIVGFLPWAASQSHLLQVESTVIIGMLVGITIAVARMDAEGSEGGAT